MINPIAANIALGVTSLVDNVRSGNVAWAVVDGIDQIVDGTAAAVPFVPGGAGTAIKAARAADKVSDVIDTVKMGNEVADVATVVTAKP